MDLLDKKAVPAPQTMSVALFFKEGSSDREYHAHVLQNGDQWAFQCHYGRRGAALTTDPKVPNWIAFPAAYAKYAEKVNEKLRKGYGPVAEAKPFQTSTYAPERTSGLLPQLLNMITRERAEELLEDDDWVMQEKKDGRCAHLRFIRGHDTVMANRKGLIVPAPQEFADQIEKIADEMAVLHGEHVGPTFFVFDLRQLGKENYEGEPFDTRDALLDNLAWKQDWDSTCCIQKVKTFETTEEKKEFFKYAEEHRLEGVVFKRKQAVYKPGRPNSGGDQLKYKFKGRATCQVLALDAKGKRSIVIGVRDPERVDGSLRPMGKCTIPVNFEMPEPGTLVEIEYLYAYPSGSLYQPVYLGPREDKDEADEYASLKFKAGTDGEDDEG